MKRRERYFTGERVHEIKIVDLKEYYGAVPDMFQTCFMCGEPAMVLHCFTTDKKEFADIDLKEPAAYEMSQELRGRFGTNFELPICELHRKALVTQ
jgi:hypothetical protein